ncbi:MAG: hypothetical protein QXJ75_05790 [Candidatus Bathyarchaeia archaeon]
MRVFLEGILVNANTAMDNVLEGSIGSPITFVAPSIELKLSCSLAYKDGSIHIAPSNAFLSNYYRLGEEAAFNVRFVLKPK